MNKLYAILLLTLVTYPTLADAIRQDRPRIHGFASQAYVHTSANNFFGDSENGSFDFTELGINASYPLSPRLRLAGQLLSRRAGELYTGSPWIDYALLDFHLFSHNNLRLGLYAGRIKNPLGLYNETRDVAHTRQGVFTPQTIYFDKVRNLTMSHDGIDLHGEYFLPNGTLLFQAGAGYALPDKNVEYTYMGQDWGGDLDSNGIAYIGRLLYEHDGGRWTIGISSAKLELDFDSSPADRALPFIGINSGTIDIDFTVLSAQYNTENWQFTTEAAIQNANFNNFGGAFSNADDPKPFGFMLEANYKFTPTIQGFIRHEFYTQNRHDKYGRKAEAKAQDFSSTISALTGGAIQLPVIPNHAYYQKTWVVGARWDINSNWMARAEYHWLDGTAILSPRENNLTQAQRYWDMFACSISYRF